MPAYGTKKYKKFKASSMRLKRFKETFPDNSMLTFGKHKGIKVIDTKSLDISYYNWLCKTFKL